MPESLKKYSFSLCFCMLIKFSLAQNTLPYNYPLCSTKVHDSGYYMKNAEAFLANKKLQPSSVTFTSPYYVRIFIRIVRQDDGTLPGCTVAEALQNFTEMNVQYNAHNICFQLAGIDFVNDTYLNNFNTSANLNSVYPAYIRNNNLDVDGAITIFVHYNFLNNTGSSGNAYGIPNNFLSVARWAATSTTVHSIFGHETGHCLGLYHTFEKVNGIQEAVTRNTGNSCYNCIIQGDLCCDTPADYPDSQDNTSATSCTYNSSLTNACDVLQYNPSTINIMSYQPWACISSTSSAISSNQRTRIQATVNDATGPIFSRVADDNLVLGSISRSTNAVRIYTAKINVTTGTGVTISHTGESQAYFVAGNSITLGPGIILAPATNGVVQVAISGCN